jgi:hypothetical protein
MHVDKPSSGNYGELFLLESAAWLFQQGMKAM